MSLKRENCSLYLKLASRIGLKFVANIIVTILCNILDTWQVERETGYLHLSSFFLTFKLRNVGFILETPLWMVCPLISNQHSLLAKLPQRHSSKAPHRYRPGIGRLLKTSETFKQCLISPFEWDQILKFPFTKMDFCLVSDARIFQTRKDLAATRKSIYFELNVLMNVITYKFRKFFLKIISPRGCVPLRCGLKK